MIKGYLRKYYYDYNKYCWYFVPENLLETWEELSDIIYINYTDSADFEKDEIEKQKAAQKVFNDLFSKYKIDDLESFKVAID